MPGQTPIQRYSITTTLRQKFVSTAASEYILVDSKYGSYLVNFRILVQLN